MIKIDVHFKIALILTRRKFIQKFNDMSQTENKKNQNLWTSYSNFREK